MIPPEYADRWVAALHAHGAEWVDPADVVPGDRFLMVEGPVFTVAAVERWDHTYAWRIVGTTEDGRRAFTLCPDGFGFVRDVATGALLVQPTDRRLVETDR